MEPIKKLRAEIENWLKEYAEDSQFELGERYGYKRVLSLLDTLQEPEVKPGEELKNAADNHIRKVVDIAGHPGWDWTTQDIADAFIAGAKWQKEQDTSDMYMSDNRHFEKVYELGKSDMKKQMMEEAVEGEVVKDISNKLAVTAKNVNLDKFKFGDKVRIIIVKE